MRHGSLFTGIGGFDLAAQWMGWENVFHCEWNEFGQKILKHYWPKAISYGDITKTDFTKHRGTIDILTGGFPCQPYSLAGKRKGKEDERHLWPEMLRAIREIQPCWVVGENVPGIINWSRGLVFHEVQTDMEAQGYKVFPVILPACSVNAPHKRERIWFVAHSVIGGEFCLSGKSGKITKNNTNVGNNGITKFTSDSKKQRLQKRNGEPTWNKSHSAIKRHNGIPQWQDFPTQSPLCSRDDGLSSKLDGITFPKWRNESIKGYGNAIVPSVTYQIFKAIEEYNKMRHDKKGIGRAEPKIEI